MHCAHNKPTAKTETNGAHRRDEAACLQQDADGKHEEVIMKPRLCLEPHKRADPQLETCMSCYNICPSFKVDVKLQTNQCTAGFNTMSVHLCFVSKSGEKPENLLFQHAKIQTVNVDWSGYAQTPKGCHKQRQHQRPLMFCQSIHVGPPTPIFLSFQFIVSCRSNTSLVRASNLVCIRWLSWSGVEQCHDETVKGKNRTGKD